MTRLTLALSLVLAACAADHLPSSRPSERSGSASLAIDARGLYWVDPARSALMHAPLGAGAARALTEAHPSLYAPIALLDDGVVWGERDGGHVRVMRASRDGSDRTMLADGDGGPIGIAVDRDRVFFSRESGAFELVELDLATANERVVVSDLPALGIALDGADLVVTRCAAGGLVRVPADGAPPRVIAPTYCPIELVLDEHAIYFTDYAEPANPGAGGLGVFVVDARGGVPRRITLADALPFAVHRGHVYAASGGEIVSVAPDGSITALARASNVRGIAVDDTLVYWTEANASGATELVMAPHFE